MAPATRPAGGRAARVGWRLSSLPASTWGSSQRWGPPRSPPRPPLHLPRAPRGCPASRCSASWPTWSSAGAAATWPWKVSDPRGPLPAVPPVPLLVCRGAPRPVVTPLGALGACNTEMVQGGGLHNARRGRAGRCMWCAAEGGLRARRHRGALSTVTAWGCMQGADAGAVHVCSGYLQRVLALRARLQHVLAVQGWVHVCAARLQCRAARVCTVDLHCRAVHEHDVHACL